MVFDDIIIAHKKGPNKSSLTETTIFDKIIAEHTRNGRAVILAPTHLTCVGR